jgi:hypothetical protein
MLVVCQSVALDHIKVADYLKTYWCLRRQDTHVLNKALESKVQLICRLSIQYKARPCLHEISASSTRWKLCI